MLTLDFSLTGWKAAIKEFLWSMIKTTFVAAIAYISFKLANIELDLTSQNAELYTIFIIVGRAGVSALKTWVTTLPGTVQTFPDGTTTTTDTIA